MAVLIKGELRNLLIVVGLIVAIYLLRDFLLVLFIAFLLILAFLPLVRFLKLKKIPKVISVSVLVLIIFALPLGLIISIGPEIVSQARSLIEEMPQLLQTLENRTGLAIIEYTTDLFQQSVSQIGGSVLSISISTIPLITSIVSVIALSIYGLIYYDETSKSLIAQLAKNKKQLEKYNKLLQAIERKIGVWVKGQAVISVFIGVLSFIAYVLLGLPFAGALAILAGILELLPGIGPALAAIPALIIALTISPQTFVFTFVAYLLIQAVESYVITPRVMSQVIKLNPFITILIVLLGAYLLGIIGAFLAIPFTLLLIVIHKHLILNQSQVMERSD